LFVLEVKHINSLIVLGLLDLSAFSKQYGHPKGRVLEKEGTKFLLNHLLNKDMVEVSYTEYNQPYLKGHSQQLSISHSHDKLAVLLHQTGPAGIDIEKIRDKVQRIQHKFLNEEERAMAESNTDRLICFWAAKEALYKVYGKKELDFVKHLRIHDYNATHVHGSIHKDTFHKKYVMACENIEDYKLVYVLNEV
jgi:4'-phosphopantetheinyl transferase